MIYSELYYLCSIWNFIGQKKIVCLRSGPTIVFYERPASHWLFSNITSTFQGDHYLEKGVIL